MVDQRKIGCFIGTARKARGWTQSRLAEELGITNKAVSKWETGRSLPDLSLFLPLCELLGITLNELMAGEYISQENLREKSEQVLLEVITSWLGQDQWKPKEEKDELDGILSLLDVGKNYEPGGDAGWALRGVSFQINRGSFVGIMGASGSGKTTLLHLIGAVDRPTCGTIKINGQDLSAVAEKERARFRRDHLGFIFQEYNLLDTLTIYENIALALTVREVRSEEIDPIIVKLAKKLEISDILNKFPCQVSGGQRQRCACGRAMAVNPTLILADEPTGALDSRSAKHLLDTFAMLSREYQATILMVTHDAISASCCDRILFMQNGKIGAVLNREEETRESFFAKILETMGDTAKEEKDVF